MEFISDESCIGNLAYCQAYKRMLEVRNERQNVLIKLINRFNKIRTGNYGYDVCLHKCINKVIQITKDLNEIL